MSIRLKLLVLILFLEIAAIFLLLFYKNNNCNINHNHAVYNSTEQRSNRTSCIGRRYNGIYYGYDLML